MSKLILKLPPTKEKIIAQMVCAKISTLRTSKYGGEEAARIAISKIVSKLKETEDAKLISSLENELRVCHGRLLT